MSLETVWSGSTWRSFPAPIMAATEDAIREVDGYSEATIARVLEVLTSRYQPVGQIRQQARIADCTVRRILRRLVARGVLEAIEQPLKRGGLPRKLYRRTQKQEAA